ncbi:MAG: cytochrome c5 family protein [Desulfuromonas sp.]|nr:MAG: cytochrome c5 family protein [Desulfuromonas sp.]
MILTLFLGATLLAGTGIASDDVGEAVYNKSCGACHNSGVMGAPKTGDKAVWAGHIKDGKDHMVENAIKGIGKMPPKGGNMKLTDEEVEEAVEYMIEKSK